MIQEIERVETTIRAQRETTEGMQSILYTCASISIRFHVIAISRSTPSPFFTMLGSAEVSRHEMAHNLARHTGEWLSDSFLTNILARFLLVLDPSGLLYSIFVPAATLFHDLPHSREHGIEEDHIGMHLAAEACYDPRAAA